MHLFEFEDQRWLPASLRNFMTDFLSFLANKTQMYRPIIPTLERGIRASKTSQIVDLGSGGGGGLMWIASELNRESERVRIVMTDWYPHVQAFQRSSAQAPGLDFVEQPVDARAVPRELKGLRTLFLSFHHFREDDACGILQDAIHAGQPVAIFEAQDRSLVSLLAMAFSPITLLLCTPWIRPWNGWRLLFTYLIPILPMLVMWDGVVSSLRTYSESELRDLVDRCEGSSSYDWDIRKVKSGPGFVLQLLGTPRATGEAPAERA
ncbi:MAG: hypothetical protein O2791_07145 [Bacteroidetes bacterium]|jgi:hypothetical protein|nr:hypothetical protein [Bacteroidota bacterium]